MEKSDNKVLNIVLFEPEIPQNTGNVARTCAATGARLHLVRPFGFEITDRNLKRAGLDYWYLVDITYYDSIDDFFAKTEGGEYFFFSTKARHKHSEVSYPSISRTPSPSAATRSCVSGITPHCKPKASSTAIIGRIQNSFFVQRSERGVFFVIFHKESHYYSILLLQ